MEKNAFLLYNDIVSALYRCRNEEDLRTQFLERLNALIPYSYASIFLADSSRETDPDGAPAMRSPLCVPEYFSEAESKWLQSQQEDDLAWLTRSYESILVRESEVLSDEQRLNSYIYKNCYSGYNIFDTLQYAIISEKRFLGIVTLLRTRIDDVFSDDDAFFMRSLGIHLTTVFKRFTYPEAERHALSTEAMNEISHTYSLTMREIQIYGMLLSFSDNLQICETLGIKENTLQKHLQNLFRKLGVSSRWEAAAKFYRSEVL